MSSRGKEEGTWNILVVDDTLIQRKQLQHMIRRLYPKTTCDSANSGEQAISLVKNLKEKGFEYDLVFMDQDMAGWKENQLQGNQTVEKLRAMGFAFPVVMRTSNCTAESLETYTRAGADAVMPKSTN
mmetsp:Transcript_12933/g.24728  ORF Transcript_12933/g.24728 Transcript_12933/m.24728 type:complete len:127 (+) Transcript_12933:59-439(+)